MIIEAIQERSDAALAAFEKREWPYADLEHYGEPLPDFTKHEHIYVAKNDDVILGFIMFNFELGVCTIENLLVGRDARRQGVGTLLLKKAEKDAKERGCHKVCIETGVDWSARSLYESTGYTVVATLPNYYAHQDFVILGKEL